MADGNAFGEIQGREFQIAVVGEKALQFSFDIRSDLYLEFFQGLMIFVMV